MKILLIPMVFAIMLSTASFVSNCNDEKLWIGVFGECQAEKHENGLQLTLQDDQTFHYTDNSTSLKTEVTGHWQLKGSTIVLSDYDLNAAIPTEWKPSKGENCLKARKGLMWIRLCRVASE